MKHSLYLWLFWMCFIQILFPITTHLASSICLEDQRTLLLQLKSNLIRSYSSANIIKLASWIQKFDCCQWVGVQCESKSGHVIGLDLSGESITSSSDNLSSLFRLQFLQRLNLANNSFNSTVIPSGIGKLSALTYLNLSNAGFGGQVPLEISQLVNLVTLDLSSLSLLGFSTLKLENPSLGKLIGSLKNLEGLYLNGVNISANGSEWGMALSSSVPNLKFLSLSNCKLYGEIDPSLEKLQSLSEIHLDQNKLDAPVPNFIARFKNLTILTLSYCELNGTFPQTILKVSTLTILDLSYNRYLEGTLPEFPLNSFLQTLVVSFSSFSGQLPNSIGHLMHLQRIDLQNCSFSGSLPSSMKQLKQLVYVDFAFNNFSGPVPSFSSAKSLSFLRLKNNILSGTLNTRDWVNLSHLVNLDLSSNFLNGEFPMSLLSLPSLQQVQVSQNNFTGKLKELSNMPSLILNTVNLSFNNLQGSVPKWLFGLKNLSVLNLSSNNFSGSLNLNDIQQLKNLSSLDLSYNSLSVLANGTRANGSSFPQLRTLRLASCNLAVLPDFLRNQSKLTFLDLSQNQIKGAIPQWIWEIGNVSLDYLNLSCNSFGSLELPSPDTPLVLRTLDIHSNQIQGEVPTLSSGIYLDYSKNNFISIGKDIGDHLLNTVYLSLSRNSIRQEIPTTLCNASNSALEVLDMSFNHFYGNIPDCIIVMTLTLGVLNLRGNNLSGNIVNNFPRGCTLSTIDIGDNSVRGQVPSTMVNCKQLEVLDFGGNQLNDTFPCWLRNLSNLRVIVLRNNSLYGGVVCSHDLGWPKLQILDIASNDFDGELEPECFSNMTALMSPQMAPTTALQYTFLQLNRYYYQNTLVVTFKGTEVHLQKILTLFMSIDVSNNKFRGNIPDKIGNLRSLIVVNLSYNGFSGSIPSSIGNLTMLESLDLSHNHLNGTIPEELTNLNFLSYLNLYSNNLMGKIPTGTQLQTFNSSAYEENKGLCGTPLPKCSASTPSKESQAQERKSSFDWLYILFGSGFGTGAALVIAPVMFWRKQRKRFNKRTDRIVSAILLAFGIVYASRHDEEPQPQDGIGNQLFDITRYHEVDAEGEDNCGRYCVFCTKLDIERKRVIHNPRCNCHDLLSISSSFSSSFVHNNIHINGMG